MYSIYQTLLSSAEGIQKVLYQDTHTLALAMEQLALAKDAKGKAQEVYDAQAADFVFDLTFGDEMSKAKNAEQREVIRDRALVQARTRGQLAQAWGALCQAQNTLDQAELSHAQAETRFKGVRVAAELQAAMINGLVADSKVA